MTGGIETAEQAVALRALGCKAGQGYRYGRAMPAGDLAARVLARRGGAAPARGAD